MRTQRIRLRNFKRFGEAEVCLRPSNCLVGPKNSGKTTLLQALALFEIPNGSAGLVAASSSILNG